MDRFIENIKHYAKNDIKYLKSNMDRFIVYGAALYIIVSLIFKIQYGQIYRAVERNKSDEIKHI